VGTKGVMMTRWRIILLATWMLWIGEIVDGELRWQIVDTYTDGVVAGLPAKALCEMFIDTLRGDHPEFKSQLLKCLPAGEQP
jgi:hypothetical protein